jgi:pseudaminic acid cytidylyltransferase
LGIIPARGGSKRIPEKNIREFFGRPMISYILETASCSGLFDTIHVSTESDRIADVVERLGFPVKFLRPVELADDRTPLMPVLRHVASTFYKNGDLFDEVWLLMACAPLVEPRDLQEAAFLFANEGGRHPVLSVGCYPAPLERAFRKLANGALQPAEPSAMNCRSQDLEKKYYDTGSFCAMPARLVLNSEGERHLSSYVTCIPYPLAKAKAIDIDDEEDWQLAKTIFAGLRALRENKANLSD